MKSGVATMSWEILLDSNNNVLVANYFGVDYFDGLSWKRDRVSKDLSKLPMYNILRKNIYKKHSFILGGIFSSGFIERKTDGFYFLEVIKETETKQVFGGHLQEVFQVTGKTIFLGRSLGAIIYDHSTKQKKEIKGFENKSVFKYHLLGKKIIAQAEDGQLFSLAKDTWMPIKEPVFLKKYQPPYVLPLKDKQFFFLAKDGKAFIGNKENQKEITSISALSSEKDNESVRIKTLANNLFIKLNHIIIVYNLTHKHIVFTKKFKQYLYDFTLDKQGNIWLSTDDGVFLVETNIPFYARINKNEIKSRFYNNDQIIDIKHNLTDLIVTKNEKEHWINKIGNLRTFVNYDNLNFLCTSKGTYILENDLVKRIYNRSSYNIFRQKIDNNTRYYILSNSKLAVLDAKFNILREEEIERFKHSPSSILYQNNILYSTIRKVIKLTLSTDRERVIKKKPLNFPRKTFLAFGLQSFNKKLNISNAYGIFETDSSNNFRIREITKDISNLVKDSLGNYDVYFSFTRFINSNKILTSPVYIGVNDGKNLPLILQKDKQGQWYANPQPFKRLEKSIVLDLVKNLKGNYEFITKDHIIEYNPKREFNTDYKFKSYVREVLVKVTNIDTTDTKQIRTSLVDSTIYTSHTHANTPAKLNYQYNTLTFTYASDSWAAYERNKYSYQLVGQDQTWSNWSKEQKKEYTNLREGTYTFQVRCKNVYDTISSVANYTFTILPPWYRTWWAYTLYSLAAIGLLAGGSMGYSRYRTRQIRQRNEELEQVVEERTEEIRAKNEEITQQNEAITQQAEELKVTNDQLKKANILIKKDRDEKVKIYLQEATEATNKLQEIQETFTQRGPDIAQKLLANEINTAGELSSIQEKVRNEFPDFTSEIDKALADKKITKAIWQVGYCLKFGRSPAEIAKILPLSNRTVSVYGTKLRKLDILEAVKK